MKSISSHIFICLLVLLSAIVANAQRQPVQWTITIDSISRETKEVRFDAKVAAGWHLYSQYIEDGGPIPTTFKFQQNGYRTLGATSENGQRVVFHDQTYDMNISWYADHVTFVQRIALDQSAKAVQGFIEYMVCNGEVCVPSKTDFSLPVSLGRK